MLKKRLMGVIVVSNGIAVQSLGFERYLPLGRPEVIAEHLNQWGVDEIAVIDIQATRSGKVDSKLLKRLTNYCQVPVTYGGGLKSVEMMTRAVKAGSDKVLINQAFFRQPELVSFAGETLGKQCVVVGIDIKRKDGVAHVFDYLTNSFRETVPVQIAKMAAELGAGEIFINSVDQDGSKQGFDLEIAKEVAESVKLPVTICGGAGRPEHFLEALDIPNISAVAAANYFNFNEHSVTIVKEFVRRKRKNLLRHDTYFDYKDHPILDSGRLAKQDDKKLKELLFEYHPQEII